MYSYVMLLGLLEQNSAVELVYTVLTRITGPLYGSLSSVK